MLAIMELPFGQRKKVLCSNHLQSQMPHPSSVFFLGPFSLVGHSTFVAKKVDQNTVGVNEIFTFRFTETVVLRYERVHDFTLSFLVYK